MTDSTPFCSCPATPPPCPEGELPFEEPSSGTASPPCPQSGLRDILPVLPEVIHAVLDNANVRRHYYEFLNAMCEVIKEKGLDFPLMDRAALEAYMEEHMDSIRSQAVDMGTLILTLYINKEQEENAAREASEAADKAYQWARIQAALDAGQPPCMADLPEGCIGHLGWNGPCGHDGRDDTSVDEGAASEEVDTYCTGIRDEHGCRTIRCTWNQAQELLQHMSPLPDSVDEYRRMRGLDPTTPLIWAVNEKDPSCNTTCTSSCDTSCDPPCNN